MPNVLDIAPVRALAKRAAARILNEKISKRYERLAFDQLMRDPRNFRPARQSELDQGPAWAQQAHARGELVSVYKTNRGIVARIHSVARRLVDTYTVAGTARTGSTQQRARVTEACDFLLSLDRADFETTARKALSFSRLLKKWEEEADSEARCEAQSLSLKNGRIWRRITSVAGLRAVGVEFRNCLARTTRGSAYGGMLATGIGQFWVLREADGTGVMVALAAAPLPTHFMEVKGPRNVGIASSDVDLAALGKAIGVRPAPPPPPPPPPSPIPPSARLALLLAQEPCRCNLCSPRRPPDFARLRRQARAS